MSQILNNILTTLKSNQVIPALLKESFVPVRELSVTYASKVEISGVLTPTQVQNKPTVSYQADANDFYTLIFADPDAPSRADPKYSPWLHWIVTNIPGSKVEEGETLAEYIGSGPPPKTGLHRYIFILCKQPTGRITFKGEYKLPFSADKRNNYEVGKFIDRWGLQPEACNFYQAEFDNYVPTLYDLLDKTKESPKLIE